VSQKDWPNDLKLGTGTMSEGITTQYMLAYKERDTPRYPTVPGIDEQFFSQK
jgi:hypothetical protein